MLVRDNAVMINRVRGKECSEVEKRLLLKDGVRGALSNDVAIEQRPTGRE